MVAVCRPDALQRGGAVLDAARNVACDGGEPLTLTDCLNFGNPEKPEIGWELAEAIEGIAETAEAVGIPVVSGNVSLYNETDGQAIPPTPVVGCVGLVPDVREVPRGWRPSDHVWLAEGDEVELIRWLWSNASKLSLAHDVGTGGLAHALAEAARAGAHGRAGAQRQPGQRDGAARGARRRGHHARHDLRHRADRGADRKRRGDARRRRRRRHGQARGGVLGRRPLERNADRL